MAKLYSNAVILSYRRSKATQQVGTNILRIEGVKARKDTEVRADDRVRYALYSYPRV